MYTPCAGSTLRVSILLPNPSVREGRVRFTTVEATVEAGPDELIACDPGVPHSVEAVTDAICLLHLTGAS